ncbi:MAG: DUF1549 and DUF1553 domain-containing protein [Planctomycetota bacterium]|nr:DUF1549 and DUF1553 domain-containing protein [Planctomycetota bacterium]MDA1178733.1 DUF1549 and DUF1553 domain-containing protein [Planctomycetota bacterium]
MHVPNRWVLWFGLAAWLPVLAIQLATVSGAIGREVAGPSAASSENFAKQTAVREQDHWSFRLLDSSAMPTVRNPDRLRNPIDAFILDKLESNGLEFSPDADKVTLMRRAYLDLTGLPPSPDERKEFLSDTADGAYERLIDRLMASPHFGERWGRHWLDVAGYADTVGFDGNPNDLALTEGKWRYRDYVIQCFNDDVPYDQFLLEQLAGDEIDNWRTSDVMRPETMRRLIATGYLRTARDQTTEPVSNIPTNFYEVLNDTVEIVGKGLLGLTVNCARCHDHKFDPILQEDYYRLMAIFTPAYNPDSWKPAVSWSKELDDRTLPDIPLSEAEEIRKQNVAIDNQVIDLNKQVAALREPYRTRLFEEKLLNVPELLRSETRAAWNTDKKTRDSAQKAIVNKFATILTVTDAEIDMAMSPVEKDLLAKNQHEIKTASNRHRSWNKIQALFDVGPPPSTYLFLDGQHENPGHEISPGYVQVLCDHPNLATMTPPKLESTSGRRTALAQWLTTRNTRASALVSRVMANRIWMHLFGNGLASTDADFGVQGTPPIHPELLDYLALEFQNRRWHIKPLIRLMMTSTVYRQSSSQLDAEPRPNPREIDPENRLYWRMPLRRLESEVIRDVLLDVSGKLDRSMGGPPVLLKTSPDGRVDINVEKLAKPADAWRRSVYLVSRRAYHHSLLSVFDQPSIATTCARRDGSAVPLQALAMLNDRMVIEVSERLAERVRNSTSSDTERIDYAFQLSLSRKPDAWEATTCLEALQQKRQLYIEVEHTSPSVAERRAMIDLCHTLLNTSEFLCAE